MRTIIRQFPEGDAILLFPDEKADPQGNILSYQFIGQHGAANPSLIDSLPKASKEDEKELIKHYEQHFNCKLEVENEL